MFFLRLAKAAAVAQAVSQMTQPGALGAQAYDLDELGWIWMTRCSEGLRCGAVALGGNRAYPWTHRGTGTAEVLRGWGSNSRTSAAAIAAKKDSLYGAFSKAVCPFPFYPKPGQLFFDVFFEDIWSLYVKQPFWGLGSVAMATGWAQGLFGKKTPTATPVVLHIYDPWLSMAIKLWFFGFRFWYRLLDSLDSCFRSSGFGYAIRWGECCLQSHWHRSLSCRTLVYNGPAYPSSRLYHKGSWKILVIPPNIQGAVSPWRLASFGIFTKAWRFTRPNGVMVAAAMVPPTLVFLAAHREAELWPWGCLLDAWSGQTL